MRGGAEKMISGQESQERSAGDVDLDGVVEPHIGEGGTEEEDEAEKTAADNGHVNNGDDLPHNVRDGEAPIQGDDSMAPGDENRSEVLMLIAKQLSEYGYSKEAELVLNKVGDKAECDGGSGALEMMLAEHRCRKLIPNNNHIMVENEGPGVMLYENGVIGEPSGLEGAPGLSNEGAGDFDPIIPGEKLHINSLEQQQIYLQKPDGDTVDEKYTNTGVCDNVNSRDSLNNTIITWLNTHHRGSCIVATFSPDGYLLASGSKDASIKIVDVDRINRAAGSLEPKPVTRTLQHHTGQINDIKFHPAGSVLVSASDDGTVRFFDATKTSLRRSFKNIQVGAPVKSLSFHPSGDYFLIGVSTRKILLYDTHTTKSYCPIEKSCITSYPCVRFAPHGAYYATADGSPRISIWDVVSSKNIYHITVADTPDYPEAPLHPAVKLVDLCWNSDGTQITVCNHDASISSYDIRTGGLLSKYRGTLSKGINPSISYSPADKYLLGIDNSFNGIIVWETLTQKVHARIPAHARPVMCVVSSPTSYSFASCSEDFKIKYWAPIE